MERNKIIQENQLSLHVLGFMQPTNDVPRKNPKLWVFSFRALPVAMVPKFAAPERITWWCSRRVMLASSGRVTLPSADQRFLVEVLEAHLSHIVRNWG